MTTIERMNPEIKEKWLEALRSGDYQQGTGRLKTIDGKFCCLGVLCDLYAKERGIEWKLRSHGYIFDGNATLLPRSATEWASIRSAPRVEEGYLMWLNDGSAKLRQHTFTEIADLIEEQL